MLSGTVKTVSPHKNRIATAVFFFVSGFGYSTWASRIPAIQQRLHLNEAQLGATLFALPVGLMLTLPVTGTLLSRYSSRYIMLTGTLLFNLMLSVLGFVQQTWQLVIVLFCFGSSRNLMNLSANAQSVGVQTLYDRSIIATFHGIWSLAGFGGAALGSWMVAQGINTSWHFLIVGILLIIFALVFYPHSLHQPPKPEERKKGFSFPDKNLLKYGFISFASMSCEGTMYDWSGIFFQKAVHASKEIVTIGFVVYMVAMTIGRFTGDRLATRYGIKPMLTYSGILIFSGLMCATLLPFPVTAGLGFMLVGFGVSCVIPMVFSTAGKTKGMTGGAAIAAVSTVGYIGFLVVPPMVGFIAQTANLRWSFALVALLGLLITWLIKKEATIKDL